MSLASLSKISFENTMTAITGAFSQRKLKAKP